MTQKHDFEQINPQTNASGRDAARQLSRRGFLKVSGMTAITAAGLTFLTACGPAAQGTSDKSSSSSSKSDTGVLGDGKTLRVGMEAAYAPYNWQTTQKSEYTIPIENVDGAYADGYDVQFAKVVGKALGMKPVAVKMSFSGLIDALNNGQIDVIIAGMSATKERKQSIDFSKPYFVGGFGLLVKKDSKYASAKSLEDFSGAAVLGQKDTLLDTVIDEIPSVNHLTPVDSVPNQLSQLDQGTCDAITYNTENTNGFLRANPDLVAIQFEKGKGFKETVPANVGLAKGQKKVLAKINKALAAVDQDTRTKMFDAAVERQPS
ncbi:transporter substrate-binding domain-containing protein [Parafannyhessea umbonata]|uniref:transporter substrate-binding domain-containing protein n=1 Tax=Parafannyhessea umbonata TaxID=604330 RepID=UPI0026F2FE0E|nr:transporter substrate-binding domain-containing protein [Parafannyhessea umbonata]MDD6601719.1 transporter substrate-binding domain-containing protein [Parafannyhessea umbonata]